MAIVKMKHLRLIAMGSDREALLRLFQRMGCVEIDQVGAEPPGDTQGGSAAPEDRQALLKQMEERQLLTRPDAQALSAARERQNSVERALTALKRYAPEKSSLLSPRPGLTEGELFDEDAAREALAAAERINGAERRIAAIQSEQTKVEGQMAQLAPWEGLDLPLDTESTDLVTIQLGTLPAKLPFEDGVQAAGEAGELAQLSLISTGRELHCCLLVCHSDQSQAVLEKLKDLGWSRANLREWTGTAADNLTALEARREALSQELAGLEEQLASMGEAWPGLKRLADRAAAEVSREESRGRTLDTSQTFYLEGWVPAERWPALEQALEPYPHACTLTDPAPEDYPKVPVQLKNNWLTRPLNMVTEMYSLPAYGSVDPNPLMAPFFILFYGMMMADMGYGLVMILAALVVLRVKRPSGTMHHFFGLMGLCGVTTFLFGALTGGFFGDFIPQLLTLIDPSSTFVMPALFSPTNDTIPVLVGSLVLGVIQIFTGMGISFVRKLKRGEIASALTQEAAWWAMFACIAGAILTPATTPFLIALAVIFLVTQGWGAKGPVKWVVALFGSLYNNITGYFSDILSYSRLMALMLAGSVVAQAFNTLGAMTGLPVAFILVSALGNTLNFGLNLLGCYIHDMRLQCLEYFNRFYQDGGRPFRPLEYNTKRYQITES